MQQKFIKFLEAELAEKDRYLDHRLKAWGRWYIKLLEHGHGYPSKSIEGRMKDDGGVLSRSTAHPEPPTNPDAEEIDKLLNELWVTHQDCAMAVRIHYTSTKFIEIEAKSWDMSRRRFYNNLKLGKMWLLGRMTR